MTNEYWEEIKKIPPPEYCLFNMNQIAAFSIRDPLVKKYAWAITEPSAVLFVAKYARGGIVEIGAGSGWWARCLAATGVDVVAYDILPPGCGEVNSWVDVDEAWYPVALGGPGMAAQHPERTLFLCWPPYDNPMATEALRAYTGERAIFIGEDEGGCTGDDAFFKTLTAGWSEIATCSIKHWSGLRDHITIYERKRKRKFHKED